MGHKYPRGPPSKRELYERAVAKKQYELDVRKTAMHEAGGRIAASESARQWAMLPLEKGKHRLAQLGVAERIFSGQSIFGQMIKWVAIIVLILFLIVGPASGTIFQMTAYLSPTILIWVLGLGALILYIRRR